MYLTYFFSKYHIGNENMRFIPRSNCFAVILHMNLVRPPLQKKEPTWTVHSDAILFERKKQIFFVYFNISILNA